MLNEKFLDELFKPQKIYNKDALKNLFHDLAHASIMRLNEASMSKLYDLMTMVFKYQILSAREPRDLILITLNHMDAMRSLVQTSQVQKQLDACYFLVMKMYGQMTDGELQRVRYSILNFFQDIRIRVSIFLRKGVQNNDGSFVIPSDLTISYGNEIPGTTRVYQADGTIVDLLNFPSGGSYALAPEIGSTELRGRRGTDLGANIYENGKPLQTDPDGCEDTFDVAGNTGYKDELNVLIAQLRDEQQTDRTSEDPSSIIHFNLFPTFDRDSPGSELFEEPISSTQHSAVLEAIMSEMSLPPESTSTSGVQSDLIQLLDSIQ
ncbi:hypothetical protein M8J77_015697 [Diaphorina citri]|nr:hypothetical protein M8J77_015697 [Diaphorina citri]